MSESTFAAFRDREYPERDGSVYVDAASFGLVPHSAVEATTSLTRRRNRPRGIPDAEAGAALRRARAAGAALLGVETDEVALVPNTTYGIQLGAALVGAGPPGRIVVSEGEFPANVLPWLSLEADGFEVRLVPRSDGHPDEAALQEEARDPDTRALAVSAIQFATGYRADLEALGRVCRAHETLLIVDAIQALGTLPLRPRELGVDVLAAGGQKWLCGPWGSGFAWIAARHRDRIRPPVVSWLAVEGGETFSTSAGYHLRYLDDARRFEPATLGVQDYLGLAVSVELLEGLGTERIRRRLASLHEPVLEWAAGRSDVRVVVPEAERRGGILSLALPEPAAALAALERAGIRAAVREGLLRLAPHADVTRNEMERIVDVLDGRAARRG